MRHRIAGAKANATGLVRDRDRVDHDVVAQVHDELLEVVAILEGAFDL